MSKYSEMKKDFITRTQANLGHAETNGTPYEFTNLVNNCFGLIVFPKSFQSNDDLHKLFPYEYSSYGLTVEEIVNIKDDDKSLASIIIHLRNGLAHGLIQQEVKNDDIVGLCVCDRDNEKSHIHTEIHLTIEELRNIALFIAEKI